MHGVRVIVFNFALRMCHGMCKLRFYEDAKQRIEDRIMAKPYDQIITVIESYIESLKPECQKLKPAASCYITSTTEYAVQFIQLIAGAGWTAGGREELFARRSGHTNVSFRICGKHKREVML